LARRFSPLSGDGQEKGKKKASDGRHDGKNPDVFNGPHHVVALNNDQIWESLFAWATMCVDQ
jgi:hypothetical protein